MNTIKPNIARTTCTGSSSSRRCCPSSWTKTLAPSQLRILPETYNYPYHLQQQISASKRTELLNDLDVLVYEEQSIHPSRLVGMDVREPLRQWLIDNLEN